MDRQKLLAAPNADSGTGFAFAAKLQTSSAKVRRKEKYPLYIFNMLGLENRNEGDDASRSSLANFFYGMWGGGVGATAMGKGYKKVLSKLQINYFNS